MAVKIETSLLGVLLFRRNFRKSGESFRGWRASMIDGTHMKSLGPDSAEAFMLWLGGGLAYAENVDGPNMEDFVKEHRVKRGVIFRHRPVWRPSKESKERGYVIHPVITELNQSLDVLFSHNKGRESKHEALFDSIEGVVNKLAQLEAPTEGTLSTSVEGNFGLVSIHSFDDEDNVELRLESGNFSRPESKFLFHGKRNPDGTIALVDMHLFHSKGRKYNAGRTPNATRNIDAIATSLWVTGRRIYRSGPSVTEQIVQRELEQEAA